MTQPMIVGNWKMNTLPAEATVLAEGLRAQVSIATSIQKGVCVVVCPPYTSLHAVQSALAKEPKGAASVGISRASAIHLGAQNCHREDNGAFTGEISVPMLLALGCTYVIVGHSERRRDQFETDEVIGLKARRVVLHAMTPIICIGETLDERQTNRTVEVLRAQLDGVASTAGVETLTKSIIAYEPVWAIGTGQAATSEQVLATHADIHRHLRSTYGLTARVLYGGSVTPANARELMQLPGVDGALVGGASLHADQFGSIVEAAVRK